MNDPIQLWIVPTVTVGTHQGTLRVPYRKAALQAFPRRAWER